MYGAASSRVFCRPDTCLAVPGTRVWCPTHPTRVSHTADTHHTPLTCVLCLLHACHMPFTRVLSPIHVSQPLTHVLHGSDTCVTYITPPRACHTLLTHVLSLLHACHRQLTCVSHPHTCVTHVTCVLSPSHTCHRPFTRVSHIFDMCHAFTCVSRVSHTC